MTPPQRRTTGQFSEPSGNEQAHHLDSRRLTSWGPHEGNCDGTRCDICGCCEHCAVGDCGCAMATVATPFELTCPGTDCACTGGGA